MIARTGKKGAARLRESAEEMVLGLGLTATQVETLVALHGLQRSRLAYVTTQELAAKLGCSRSAAWDRLRALKEKGVVIGGLTGFAVYAEIREALRVLRGGVA